MFQFESGGMVDLLRKAHPTRFEDLAALNALYRPGALDAGMVDEYVRRKNGTSKAKYVVPAMKEFLEETYGVIVYQEQVMQIAQAVAGYSLGQADLLRKAMGKKQKEVMEAERSKFVSGAVANGYDQRKANEIFDFIEPFARYGFNKSHSVAYALLAYQTAWLKAHYPRYFMAAVLSSEMDKTDNVVKFIHECESMGIRLLPPDVNESNFSFTVVRDNIRFGLGAVKGIGEGAIESILKARQQIGRFIALDGFCEHVDLRACNKKVLEALIKSGSFDSFGGSRKALFDQLEGSMTQAQKRKEEKEIGQNSLFGMLAGGGMAPRSTDAAATRFAPAPPAEWAEEEKLAFEKETLGFYITGHPLNRYREDLELFAKANTSTLAHYVDQIVDIGGIVGQLKKSKIKKGPNEGKLMAKFVLDDQYGSVDVVVFSDLFQKVARWLENGVPILMSAAVKDTGGVPSGRSASLASAEQQAQLLNDEYGGHPEEGFHTSGFAARVAKAAPSVDDEKGEDELERERIGVDVSKVNLALFSGGAEGVDGEEEDNGGAGVRLDTELREEIAAAGARSHLGDGDAADLPTPEIPPELPITPELNAIELMPLDGIRDRKVKELCLEIAYGDAGEETVKRIREIVEKFPGEIPAQCRAQGRTEGAGAARRERKREDPASPESSLPGAARARAHVRAGRAARDAPLPIWIEYAGRGARPMTVFFTGFPGFLGSSLLPRIAARRRAEEIVCIVQPKFMAVAKEALGRIAAAHDPRLSARVRLVAGDIATPGLGLPAEMARDLTEVWHLAAIYDLSVARNAAHRVNVEGTRNVLDFAAGSRALERVHYVSTCYVSGRHHGRFMEGDLEKGQAFNNFYEETKHLAEAEIRRRMAGGLPATIYRPAVVTGDSTTGATQKYDGPYYVIRWIVKQPRLAIMPTVGEIDRNSLNVVPRDWLIDAIDRLAGMERSRGVTYQLADPDPPSIREMLDGIAGAAGKKLVRVPLPLGLAKWSIDQVPGVFRLMQIPSTAIDYFVHPATYDTTNSARDLAGSGLALPRFRDYCANLVRYVEQHPDVPSAAMA